jgi:ankyrin repeat protein
MEDYVAAVKAVRGGDAEVLRALLAANPTLANARVDGCRTLLHVVTDWPGHFPQGPAIVALLVSHGADVNARLIARHPETPLHWAASTNDVAVLEALLDYGANIEASGAVIGEGTPLSDAVAFAQWDAARKLIERGAKSRLWEAAALGLIDRIERFFAEGPAPEHAEITTAFWCACHGGQRGAAEFLLARGADPEWIGYDKLTPVEAARRSGASDVVAWLEARKP